MVEILIATSRIVSVTLFVLSVRVTLGLLHRIQHVIALQSNQQTTIPRVSVSGSQNFPLLRNPKHNPINRFRQLDTVTGYRL